MSGKRARLLGRMQSQRETSWRPATIYDRHGLPLSAESLRATSERLRDEADAEDKDNPTEGSKEDG